MPATIELPPVTDLAEELVGLLRQVPRGQITTYGDLARSLGDKSAARWVGTWMLDHPHGATCPCHRVVRVTGDERRGDLLTGDNHTFLEAEVSCELDREVRKGTDGGY